jgi:hypothetical protein
LIKIATGGASPRPADDATLVTVRRNIWLTGF